MVQQDQRTQNEVIRLDYENVVRFYQFLAIVVQTSHHDAREDCLLDYLELTLFFALQGKDEIAEGTALLQEEEQSWPVRKKYLDHGRTRLHALLVLDQSQTQPALEVDCRGLLTQICLVDIGKNRKGFIEIDAEMYNFPALLLNTVIDNDIRDKLNFAQRQHPCIAN